MLEENNQENQNADQTNSDQVNEGTAAGQAEETAGEDIEKVKAVAAVAYLIFFLPLLTNPESEYGKFHANQGLLLLITALAINIVGGIIPILGWFLILPLGFIFVLVLFIMGIVNAVNGRKTRLPLIGGFDILK